MDGALGDDEVLIGRRFRKSPRNFALFTCMPSHYGLLAQPMEVLWPSNCRRPAQSVNIRPVLHDGPRVEGLVKHELNGSFVHPITRLCSLMMNLSLSLT
jgi:hypothetical protein